MKFTEEEEALLGKPLVMEMTRVARPGGLVVSMEPDFLAERGYSTVPEELELLRKLLLLTSDGSDLGFGPKAVALFRGAGLQEIEAFVLSPVVVTAGDETPTFHRERAGRCLAELVEEWRAHLEESLRRDEYESLAKEAAKLDSLRDEQLSRGNYCAATIFPL